MESLEVIIEKRKWTTYLMCVLGSLISSTSINLFVAPMHFYSGGVMGIAQIIQTLIVDWGGVDLGRLNLSGLIYLAINIPLLIIAFRGIGKQFLIKTTINIVCTTIFVNVIPILANPIIDDRLTCAIIGGMCCGLGGGITLMAGGSGGGTEVVGVLLAKKLKNFSVGRLSMIVNAVIYISCIFLFDVSVAIYCIIYAVFSMLIVDRVHIQTINVQAMIFTRTDGKAICDKIINKFDRSATVWQGVGSYTDKETRIIYCVLSKYEAGILRRDIKEIDPHAFVVLDENCRIEGNFKRHL